MPCVGTLRATPDTIGINFIANMEWIVGGTFPFSIYLLENDKKTK